jgi:DNA invertase Pin-like site-specific DNA recombinase
MRAIKLIRVSTPGQAAEDRYGIARQEDQCAVGEKAYKLVIVRTVYVQESGKFIMEDTDFQSIVADLQAGLADGILVAEQSRLVRPEDLSLFQVFGLFQRMRKMIWTPTAAIDPTTPEGMMLLGINGLMDGLELGKLKARMLGARERLRKDGFAGSGGCAIPKGVIYTKIKGHRGGVWSYGCVDDPTYPQKVKEAFRMLVEDNAPYQRIAVHLDVSERGVQVCLQNTIWIGYRRRKVEHQTAPVRVVENLRTPLKPGEKIRRYRPARPLAESEDIATNLVSEPLISRELFDRAQRIIATRRLRYTENKRSANTLIPGPMIRCECCGDGHYMKAKRKGTHDYSRYYCASRHQSNRSRTKTRRRQERPAACTSKSFRCDEFERAVEYMFSEGVTGKQIVEALDAFAKANKRAPAKAKSIDAELAVLDAAHTRGYRQYALGKATEAQWDTLSAEIEAKRRVLLADRPEPVMVMYDANSLAQAIVAAFAEFEFLERAEKRDLLRRAVREFVVNRNAEVLSIKLSGGFLGGLEMRAKSGTRIRLTPCRRPAYPLRTRSRVWHRRRDLQALPVNPCVRNPVAGIFQ